MFRFTDARVQQMGGEGVTGTILGAAQYVVMPKVGGPLDATVTLGAAGLSDVVSATVISGSVMEGSIRGPAVFTNMAGSGKQCTFLTFTMQPKR